ncbi:MAG: outer membrane protein assembly factor BamE [Verrucomicrobiota bacterium]
MTLLAFASSSCSPPRLRQANVDEVSEGMSKKQVESILGPPTTIDAKDALSLKKTNYIYQQGAETVTIIFKDDKVQTKSSTLSR